MNIKKLIQKAFIGGTWYVAYRRKGTDEFKVIETPDGMWIADPFVYEVDGEVYIFVEVFEDKKKIASIGYYKFENDIPVYKGLIIEEKYHMSYPCIFEYLGEYYIIPESSANESISLYKAEVFPNKWTKEKDLLLGERFVDSTVVKTENGYNVISYKVASNGWKLVQFDLDMKNISMEKKSYKSYSENIARPAGYIFDQCKRPAQDCRNKYGENLIIYQIDSWYPYSEHFTEVVSASKIVKNMQYDRIHTYTNSCNYEVVDLFKEKFDLFHGVKIFIRAYLRNWFS